MRDEPRFTDIDRAFLAGRGIPEEEARRQVELLLQPPRHQELLRPCLSGDGVEVLGEAEAEELVRLADEHVGSGTRLKFVPASGAATRMFRSLIYFHRGQGSGLGWGEILERARAGHAEAKGLVGFRDGLQRLPFREDLRGMLRRRGHELDRLVDGNEIAPVLDALLSPDGLAYAELPKGLVKFHDYPDGSRTAFEEHLVEAAAYARDGRGTCRLHLTVSPEHLRRFEELFQRTRAAYESRLAVRFEVGFSVQKPSTDTLCVDRDGRIARDGSGDLVLRPGGHGALIDNLGELGEDLVFIKNIDNIQPDGAKPTAVRWKKVLAGYLIRLRGQAFDYHRKLREGSPSPAMLDEALEFVQDRLHVEPGAGSAPSSLAERRALVLDRLNRPLRVCGVVRNVGEPGGGPFWVRGDDGTASLQIVEMAQIDPDSPQQQAVLRRATHFNPVDLVCGLRDADGRPFDLRRYVDPAAVIVTRKSSGGRELKVLERPGLWNGAMARWNTAFVEVPLATFTPVKTVLDLLRPEHQPA
jgi:hypothetical protein